MTFIDYFKKQFIEEAETTRKMLSRVPDDQLGFAPHPKSMKLKDLAGHLADLPGWVHMTFTTDQFDYPKDYEEPRFEDNNELLAFFEKRYQQGLSTLAPQNEAVLNKPWTYRSGETIFDVSPKIEILRMSLSQQIHHRAQLGVYLRLLNVPIPGSYGPSADENTFN